MLSVLFLGNPRPKVFCPRTQAERVAERGLPRVYPVLVQGEEVGEGGIAFSAVNIPVESGFPEMVAAQLPRPGEAPGKKPNSRPDGSSRAGLVP